MGLKADEVFQAGLELDSDERAIVANRLLASLQSAGEDASKSDVDAAWRDEIDARVEGILSGKVELVDGAESHARVRQLLAELHE